MSAAALFEEVISPGLFHEPDWVLGELHRRELTDSEVEDEFQRFLVMRHEGSDGRIWWVAPPAGASLDLWRASVPSSEVARLEDALRTAVDPAGQADPRDNRKAFFEAVHEGLEGMIDLRFIVPDGPAHRHEAASIDEALELIDQYEGEANCYCGIARRRRTAAELVAGGSSIKPGSKGNLGACRAYWVDIDFRPDYPETHRIEVLERVDDLPSPPSMIVESGCGMHLYFLAEKPFSLASASAILAHERTLKGLCDYLGGDRAATDSTRIMRIPGTTNVPDAKKRANGRGPTKCRIVVPDTGGRL